MSQPSHPTDPVIPGDMLPPVEPPSAGFILQLFIVPGIIVAIIVMVWLLFNWVVRTTSDPQEFVRALRRGNDNSFEAAFNLAQMLANPGQHGTALRQNAELATELAAILDADLEAGSMNEQSLKIRYYLCRALGEFEVPEGLAVLVKAAGSQRSDEESVVRLAALQAIAVLADNVRRAEPTRSLSSPEVDNVLLAASHDSDARIRATAAFVLGVVGGEKLDARLNEMLADSNADVRYNAATEAAAHGDAGAIPVLAEMLDPDETAGVELEKEEAMRPHKRAMLVRNALEGVKKLVAANAAADFAPVRQQLERLLASHPHKVLKVEVEEVLEQLPSATPATTTGN
ncbi:MAG TPA: HEAT repeat domain-containing protein [Pirellulales bacterium]|jgi:hypothetical protein